MVKNIDKRYAFSLQKEIEFTDYVCRGDSDSAIRLFRGIYQEGISTLGDTDEMQECLLWNFAISVRRIESSIISEQDVSENAGWMKSFSRNESAEKRMRVLEERIEQMCLVIQKELMDKDQATVRQIKNYIQQHYQSINLSNGMIAEHFHMNAAYLSTFFKKKTGTNLLNYIQRVRLEKAQELLTTTDMTVEEVGKAVGYSNGIALIRMFKKKIGVTPTMYRDSNR